MKKTLLIGNDINQVSNNYDWEELIINLLEFTGTSNSISYDENKPFPLLYEEIFVEAMNSNRIDESRIKNFISSDVSKLFPNEIHERIVNSNIDNILTTNYDFTLEQCLTSSTDFLKNDGIINENLYSIFRHYQLGKKRFWHIHGDANYSRSITLGYEHYSGYLQQMRNYIATGTGNSYKKKFRPLVKRLDKMQNEFNSWLDFIFTHDVHIFGLKMDFIEIHLWWLLTYRKRVMINKKISTENKIFYYYPSGLKSHIKNKLDLFKSTGVTPVPLKYDEKKRSKYYNSVLDLVLNSK